MAKKKTTKYKYAFPTDYLRYSVEIAYDRGPERCTCSPGDMCRCGIIDNARTVSVDIDVLLEHMINAKTPEIDKYCLHRILTVFKCWEHNLYMVNVCGGYYGEEIEGITFRNHSVITEKIQEFCKLKTVTEKILFVLTLEYGFILESLKGRTFTHKTINKSELIFGNDEYHKRIDSDLVAAYSSYGYSRGIVIPVDRDPDGNNYPDRYRIIDGYHRCTIVPEGEDLEVYVGE